MIKRTAAFLRALSVGLILVAAGCRTPSAAPHYAEAGRGAVCSVYFSPHGGCTDEVVRAIRGARQSVLVQAYSFTSQPIAEALIEAARRGVRVEVILDKSQRAERHTSASELLAAGIPVEIDAVHAIAHNKVIVIDGLTVLTGSFNFTQAAEERNAENLLVIEDRRLAAQYAANWHAHWQHAERYRPDQ